MTNKNNKKPYRPKKRDKKAKSGGEDKMNEPVEKFAYKFSCAMLNITEKNAGVFEYWAKKNIPAKALFSDDSDGIEGYEDVHHVTVKYGIHDVTPEKLIELIQGAGKVDLMFEKVTKFTDNPKFDVVKVDVKSDKLRKLNKIISDNMECTDSFDEYKPHVTLAYVKKGECEDLVGNDFFNELEDMVDEIYFTSRTGKEHFIDL